MSGPKKAGNGWQALKHEIASKSSCLKGNGVSGRGGEFQREPIKSHMLYH
jgi:hypothetical protein